MTALVASNDKLDGPAMEKRKLDQKLDKALEESFPGSDPVSISQPAPDHKPNISEPIAMVNGAAEHGASESPMKVTCPECSAEAEIMNVNDSFAYKLICPVLRDYLARRRPDNGIDCPHMGPVIRIAVLQIGRGKR
jgi:hypothetical protein